MKRLLFALALLLVPVAAKAQTFPDAYAVASPAHITTFVSGVAVSITSGIVHRLIRPTCTVACYIWVNVSGANVGATKATGVYLPANSQTLFAVTPGSRVSVIGTNDGTLHVIELSR